MKTKNRTILAAATLSIGLLSATGANAALISVLGGQAVNDTDLNVTWASNANLAASNTFGVSGISGGGFMAWDTAQSWIGAMNTANYLGYHDWRLPTTLQSDASCSIQAGVSYGYNCTGSEMGHLFYNELGGVAGSTITTTHNANYSLFSNVQSYRYWSTEYAPSTLLAWNFDTQIGYQYGNFKDATQYALAVRPGQVAAVPEADTWAMLLAGLGLVGAMARRRKQAEI
jgi:MYXO-CTERM domain-containing protein